MTKKQGNILRFFAVSVTPKTMVSAKLTASIDEKGLVRHMESGDISSQQEYKMDLPLEGQKNWQPGKSEILYAV